MSFNGQNDQSERREYPRVPVDFLVTFKVLEKSSPEEVATALDISVGGVGLLASAEISSPEGRAQISLTFDLPCLSGESRPVSATGEVRYCLKLTEENRYRVGVKFLQIADEDKLAIADFVRMRY